MSAGRLPPNKTDMKKIWTIMLCAALLSCNNNAEERPKIGDTLRHDPQTGQPITINRDTVPVGADSTNR